VLNEKGKKVLAAANKKLTTRIDLSPYGAGVISVENSQKAFDEVRKNINSAKESASLAFPKSQSTITGGNEKQWEKALKFGEIDQATYDLLTGTSKKSAKLTTPSDTSRSAIQKQMESYNLMSKSMATPMPRRSKPNKPITKEQSAKIGKGLKSAKNVLSGGKKTAKALSPMTKTAKKRKEFYGLMAEMDQPSQGQSSTQSHASNVNKSSHSKQFVDTKSKNHLLFYNGKMTEMDQNLPQKEQFKYGSMRIADNLPLKGEGIIKTPKNQYYRIATDTRTAKRITESKAMEIIDSMNQPSQGQSTTSASQ
jgi:hypothetical protein